MKMGKIVITTTMGVIIGTLVAIVVMIVLAGLRGLLTEYSLRWVLDVAAVLVLVGFAYRRWRTRGDRT